MAAVTIEMSSDEKKLFKGLQRIISQQKKMAGGFKKVKADAKSAGKASERSFGQKAVGQLKGYVQGLVSVSVAVQQVQQMLAAMRQEAERAGQSLQEMATVEKALVQVATSSQDLAGLRDKAQGLTAQFGIDRAAARELVFSARSEGFEKDLGTVAKASLVADVGSLSQVAGQVPGIFKGQVSTEQAISGTLLAAEKSRLKFGQVGNVLPSAAEGAAAAKSSFEETVALVAVLAKSFKSGEVAADRIKAFGAKVSIDEGLKGKGIVGAFEELEAASPERRRKFLGSSIELNTFYDKVKEEIDLIKQRRDEVAADAKAGTDNQLSRKVNIALEDERLSAAVTARKGAAAKEAAEEQRFGVGEAKLQAAIDQAMADVIASGGNFVSRYFASGLSADVARLRGLDPEAARQQVIQTAEFYDTQGVGVLTRKAEQIRQQRVAQGGGINPDSANKIGEAAKSFERAAEMNRNAVRTQISERRRAATLKEQQGNAVSAE